MPGFSHKKRKSIEQVMQVELIQLRNLYLPQLPELRLLHHIPNGGWRTRAEAGILMAMGVVSGMPDLHLPVGTRGFSGLYLELKAPGGVVSESQQQVIGSLRKVGHCVQVCDSVDFAWACICWFLAERHVEGTAASIWKESLGTRPSPDITRFDATHFQFQDFACFVQG